MPPAELVIRRCDDPWTFVPPHRDAMLVAYDGFFPADSPFPTDETLAAEWSEALAHGATCWVADADGRAVGTVGARAGQTPEEGEIFMLYVAPERWGQGVGDALLAEALDHLRETGHRSAGLWVLSVNDRARRWYERRGWALVEGVTQSPYRSLEVRYTRPL